MINRVARLKPQMNSGSPTRNMKVLLGSLSPSVIVPQPDKYYVFGYKAKTKNIQYDQHPFIVCTGLYKWGFSGHNFHMGARRYTWAECVTNLYEIYDEELNDIDSFPLAKIVSS